MCALVYSYVRVCVSVCPSSVVMVQRGEVSLPMRAVMRSSTLSQALSVRNAHTDENMQRTN